MVFMLRMVVPMFEDIFKQNQVELPGITKMIITASDLVSERGWIFLLGIAGVVVFRKTFSGKPWFKKHRDLLLLKLPYVGTFVRTVYLSQFTQAMALLAASKVPLLNGIQLVDKMISFYPMNKALDQVAREVLSGRPLHESIKGHTMFDNKMASLLKVAEETNQTEYIFERLNHQYATEVAQKSKMLSTIMEPLIIILVGIFVGVILVSMYLPMFRLSSVIG